MNFDLHKEELHVANWDIEWPSIRRLEWPSPRQAEAWYQEYTLLRYVLYYCAVFILGFVITEGGLWVFQSRLRRREDRGEEGIWGFRREFYIPVVAGVVVAVCLVTIAHAREVAKEAPEVIAVDRLVVWDVPMREGADSRTRWNTPWPVRGVPQMGIQAHRYSATITGVFTDEWRSRALFVTSIEDLLGKKITLKPQVNTGTPEHPVVRWADTDVAPEFSFKKGGEQAWRIRLTRIEGGEVVISRWDE